MFLWYKTELLWYMDCLWNLGFWKYRVSGSCRDCLDQATDRIGLYNYWTKNGYGMLGSSWIVG